MPKDIQKRIVIDPKVMAGKPVIKGTRIPVELILKMLAQNISGVEIIQEYPVIKHEDIQAALLYASDVVSHEDLYPLEFSGAKH